MSASETERSAFLAALQELDQALAENDERSERMRARILELEEACATGRPIREIVPDEETPPLVQLLTESADVFQTYGARVRRTEARVLHREGLTMDRIAKLFGVSRQRVSSLLRS
jgi:hypothetical protein